MSYKLLVVDDEESILFAVGDYFRLHGCEVDCAREMEEAEALLAHRRYSAIIADLRLTGIYGTEGLQIISDVRQRSPWTRIVLLHKPKPLAEIAQIVFALLEKNDEPTLPA